MNPVNAAYLIEAIGGSKWTPQGKERKFINDVRVLISKGRYLTEKQASWLNVIYRRSQGGGDFQKRDYV